MAHFLCLPKLQNSHRRWIPIYIYAVAENVLDAISPTIKIYIKPMYPIQSSPVLQDHLHPHFQVPTARSTRYKCHVCIRVKSRSKYFIYSQETLSRFRNFTVHNLLLVIIMFADNLDIVSDQINRVESNPKLANEVKVVSFFHMVHKSCNCTAYTRFSILANVQ